MKTFKVSISILLLTALLTGCNNLVAPYKANPKLLRGEWLLDSIDGHFNKWQQDWVYFLDSGKFYKFTDWYKTYLIDSSLYYDYSFIYKGNLKLYTILFVDSSNLILKDTSHISFFYKRWRKNDLNKKVSFFLSRVPSKLKINGYWQVVYVKRPEEYDDVMDGRDKLNKGNVLHFSDDGMITAFKSFRDTIKLYKYTYKIFDDNVDFQDFDAIMSNKLLEITDSTLILDSRRRFRGSLYKLKKVKQN